MTPPKNNNGPHPWTWFTDKILPPIFVAVALSVMAAAYQTHIAVSELSNKIAQHSRDLVSLQNDVTNLRANAVTRSEQLETLKRIEQQLEITMLRAGIKAAPRLTQ
jgi:hypothetical protein